MGASKVGVNEVDIATTDAHHIEIGGSFSSNSQDSADSIVKTNTEQKDEQDMKSGINDVDIDSEMAELAKNQIKFKYASRLLSESFRGIQKSIRGQI